MDLMKYCIRHMSSKEYVANLFDTYSVDFRKSDTYEKLANRIDVLDKIPFTQVQFKDFFRSNWKPCPKSLHIKNLKSGSLNGHSWHGTMPSMMHLSMQNKVRDCIAGKFELDRLIEIGSNIMKHEYFMVAAHDLIESEIIQNFEDIIPPIGSRSVSDFVLNGVPFDLKNTNYFGDWNKRNVNKNKQEVAEILFRDADVARLRKQAQRSLNGWGLNRFYVMVEDQTRWMTNPEGILDEVCEHTSSLSNPFEIKIEDLTIQTHLIAI